jgi:hypothetical protein
MWSPYISSSDVLGSPTASRSLRVRRSGIRLPVAPVATVPSDVSFREFSAPEIPAGESRDGSFHERMSDSGGIVAN